MDVGIGHPHVGTGSIVEIRCEDVLAVSQIPNDRHEETAALEIELSPSF
jgi:hypothetical protein